jgi:DNA-binding CsgD family transcriptional regulator
MTCSPPKQFRVALLVTSGMKNRDIAMILRTTENMVKNILRDIYDRSGCSNRVELAVLMIHEAKTGMYEEERIDRELGTLRSLTDGIDEELTVIDLTSGSGAPSSHKTSQLNPIRKRNFVSGQLFLE